MYTAKKAGLITLVLLNFMLVVSPAASFSFEQIIARRQSIRGYTNENVSSEQLLEVLWAACGVVNDRRCVPRMGQDYSLVIFAVNETGSYRYMPETSSLSVYDLGVNKETIRPNDQVWPSDANVVLVIIWDQTKMNNEYLASAEAGCLVQNIYLAASTLGLGTCCVAGIEYEGLRGDLKLPSSSIPLLVMPLGYPSDPYPNGSPNYDIMTGNLPLVQYCEASLKDALNNLSKAQTWSSQELSPQELSQLLWAAYGYTNVIHGTAYHRTTPSSVGIYPLVIYVSNASGIYQYLPQSHSVVELLQGDRRLQIANGCSAQTWAADAPATFIIAYDPSYNDWWTGDISAAVAHECIEVDAGAVIQQLFLEASAWNLRANIVTDGLENWDSTGAEKLRTILELSSWLIPLYIVPVGKRALTDLNVDGKVNIIDVTVAASAFGTTPGDPRWNAAADLDQNRRINIVDVTRVALDFGKTA